MSGLKGSSKPENEIKRVIIFYVFVNYVFLKKKWLEIQSKYKLFIKKKLLDIKRKKLAL